MVRAGTDPVPGTGRGTTEERMDESLLSIGELAAHLIDLALDAGGPDNVGVTLARV